MFINLNNGFISLEARTFWRNFYLFFSEIAPSAIPIEEKNKNFIQNLSDLKGDKPIIQVIKKKNRGKSHLFDLEMGRRYFKTLGRTNTNPNK